MSSSRDATDKR